VFTANQNNYFIIFKNEWCNFRGKLSLNTIKHKKKKLTRLVILLKISPSCNFYTFVLQQMFLMIGCSCLIVNFSYVCTGLMVL